MSEELSLNSIDDDSSQQNLGFQNPNIRILEEIIKRAWLGCWMTIIFFIHILWNLYVWFIYFLDFSFFYNSNIIDIYKQYYNTVNAFIILCIVLSCIIFGDSFSFFCCKCKTKINIIKLFLVVIQLSLFIFYCINLFIIFYSKKDIYIPIISMISEFAFIITVIIFDQMKIIK